MLNALGELLAYLSLYVLSDSKKLVNGIVISVLSVVTIAFWLSFLIAVCRLLVTIVASDVLIDSIWLLNGMSNLSGLSDSDRSNIVFSVSRVIISVSILIALSFINNCLIGIVSDPRLSITSFDNRFVSLVCHVHRRNLVVHRRCANFLLKELAKDNGGNFAHVRICWLDFRRVLSLDIWPDFSLVLEHIFPREVGQPFSEVCLLYVWNDALLAP